MDVATPLRWLQAVQPRLWPRSLQPPRRQLPRHRARPHGYGAAGRTTAPEPGYGLGGRSETGFRSGRWLPALAGGVVACGAPHAAHPICIRPGLTELTQPNPPTVESILATFNPLNIHIDRAVHPRAPGNTPGPEGLSDLRVTGDG